MKVYAIIAFITIICLVEGRPDSSIFKPRPRKLKKEQTTTEAAVTKGPIKMLPKNEIKFVEPEKKPQPSLSTLISNGEKRPLMRKFVPRAKPRPAAVTVSRRPLMKHRQFVFVPTTPKPQSNKAELFTSKRRKILSPLQNKTPSTENTAKSDDSDDYDKALNDDLMPAGSIKVYRRIIGDLRKRFEVKSNKPSVGKSKYTYYIFKANDIAFLPIDESYYNGHVERKSDVINEDEDKKEFIFAVNPPVKKVSALVNNVDNSSKKPTQTTDDANDSLALKTSVTPKDESIVVPSTPNIVKASSIDNVPQSTTSIPKEDDNKNYTPNVASPANITKDVVIESPPSDVLKQNNISDLILPPIQSVLPKMDIVDDLLVQSTPNIVTKKNKIDDTIKESTPSVTPKDVLDESDLGTSPSLPVKEREENTLNVGDGTSQNLEKTDVV